MYVASTLILIHILYLSIRYIAIYAKDLENQVEFSNILPSMPLISREFMTPELF